MKNLARTEGECRCWPVDVGELGVPQVDAATSGSSVGESVTGVMSHRFLFIKESARLSPYLAHQLSMFCRPTSEFIRVSRCFRKMMVALKGMRSYTGSGQSPMSSLRDNSSSCSSVECSEVLTTGCVS
jgi:hypothetical protein